MQGADHRPQHSPATSRRRQPQQDVPNSWRTVLHLPPDLVGDGSRFIGSSKPGGNRGVGYAARMGRHVRHGARLARSPGCRYCGRVADLASRGVRLSGQGADPPDPHLATGEGPQPVDGIAWTRVTGRLRLEQRQGPLGTVGGPRGQHLAVVLAQGQGTRLTLHTKDSPTG